MFKKFKLYGFEKLDSDSEKYYCESNLKASRYMTFVVLILEIYTITNVTMHLVNKDIVRSNEWIFQHYTAYLSMVISSAILYVFGKLYFSGKISNLRQSVFLLAIYSAICCAFGMYISYADYMKGEQILTFLTMEIFVFGLFVWRPWLSLLILTTSFGGFYLMIQVNSTPSYATKLNFFIMFCTVWIVSISNYRQKMADLKKEQSLKEINTRLSNMVEYDELTGIRNMNYFYDSANKIDFSGKAFAFIDVENFKNYNEHYGFLAGNELLKLIAKKINDIFANDLSARLSDDHFVVLTDEENLKPRIDRLFNEINEEVKSEKIGFKCGYYVAKSEDKDASIACDRARYAVSSIKRDYSLSVIRYDEKIDEDFRRKQYIINNIDKAIEEGYIIPHYQPIVDATSKKVIATEALARWKDPNYGMLSPGVFIPVLEEHKLINKLDRCMVDLVLKDIKSVGDKAIPVSINLSRLDFEIGNPVSEIEAKVLELGIDKKMLHIEITESAVSLAYNQMKQSLEAFRELGYEIWLDDFGAAYSSLNVLADFKIDVVKLDMAFLKDVWSNDNKKIIVKDIIKIMNELKFATLCEGVETQEVSQFLQDNNCDMLQGYLYGKAMPKEEFILQYRNS